MGFLDKILGSTKTARGITNDINAAQKSRQRMVDGERERIERERIGQEIENYYIGESRRKGFPYDCFFEWEFEMVEKALQADDSLQGTLDIIMCARDYILNNRNLGTENDILKYFNVNHSKIWIEMLLKKARNGSCYAKAALADSYFKDYPELIELIAPILNEKELQQFSEDVKTACENKNKAAMVAFAFFMCIGSENEKERKSLYLKAGELGSSEAYQKLFFDVNNHWNSEEGLKYALAAAECDDGPEAYFFQEKIGDAYYYGDGWNISVDKAKGLEWYRRSAANGHRGAIRTLEILQKSGEI